MCFLSSFNSSNDKTSFSERWGKMSSLGFLVLSLEILVYPSKTISLPLAVNVYLSNAIFGLTKGGFVLVFSQLSLLYISRRGSPQSI